MKGAKLVVLLAAVLSLALIIGKSFAEDSPQPVAAESPSEAAAPVKPSQPQAVPQATAAAVQPIATAVQTDVIPVAAKPMETQDILPPATTEFETQWVWGEIISLDPQNKEATINYFDYETDTEKELKLTVNETTRYENVASLNDLKLHDTISVDYILGADGKYMARNISVEKPEEAVAPLEKAGDKPAATSGMKP
jgi:hypothetical protein